MSENKPVIPTDLAMMLRPAQNGGWIIESVRESHLMPSVLGAFTTPADMLAALQEAFYPADERQEKFDFLLEMAKLTPPAMMVKMMEEAVDPSSLVKAADNLCFHAQTTGGTAGRDDDLVSAIEQYNAAREQYNEANRKETTS